MLKLTDQLLALLGLFRQGRIAKDERYDRALTAVNAAVTETQLYIGDLDRGQPRNGDREGALARLWAQAAIPLRTFDVELAERCLLKSSYWAAPEEWTHEQIRAAHIGIQQVAEYARQLVRENP